MGVTRRSALQLGAAGIGVLGLPRFAIGQADNRPSITIAVQKVANSNTLDVLREQSNVGERVFFTSIWEGADRRDWRGSLGRARGSRPSGAGSTTRPSSSRCARASSFTTAPR